MSASIFAGVGLAGVVLEGDDSEQEQNWAEKTKGGIIAWVGIIFCKPSASMWPVLA
jgi:hypothetical protein